MSNSLTIAAALGLWSVWMPKPQNAGPTDWPQTRAERTNYAETSHYDDVIDFLEALQERGAPISVRYVGASPAGLRIPLVIVSSPPVATPVEAKRSGKPIVYIEANIHAGEVEGKEAALAIVRRLSQEAPAGLLSKLIVVVAPIYNIDGNEKFDAVAKNRPEQDGPGLVGVRANGQGLDLNRDGMKAETNEMRAMLEALYSTWDPDVMLDLHTTDGTRHGYELTYSPCLNPNTESGILKFDRDEMLPHVRSELRSKFGMETFDYGNVETRNGSRAWATFGEEGRYMTNYVGLRNRIGVLSEATTYIPFKDRVVATDRFVTSVLDYVAAHAGKVLELTRGADARVTQWGLNPASAPALGVRFDFESRGTESTILEKGPPTAKRPLAVENVRMPIFDRFKATRTARFPAAYLLPASEIKVVELLRRHGIVVERLEKPWRGKAQAYRIKIAMAARSQFQGHRLVRMEGEFRDEQADAKAGDFLVRTSQPLGILIFNLLEPESLDGVISWEFLASPLFASSDLPIRKLFENPRAVTEVVR